jgi:hypothetical protein
VHAPLTARQEGGPLGNENVGEIAPPPGWLLVLEWSYENVPNPLVPNVEDT